jgi:hypothetical protein
MFSRFDRLTVLGVANKNETSAVSAFSAVKLSLLRVYGYGIPFFASSVAMSYGGQVATKGGRLNSSITMPMTMTFNVYSDGKGCDMTRCGLNQNRQGGRVPAKSLRADAKLIDS